MQDFLFPKICKIYTALANLSEQFLLLASPVVLSSTIDFPNLFHVVDFQVVSALFPLQGNGCMSDLCASYSRKGGDGGNLH